MEQLTFTIFYQTCITTGSSEIPFVQAKEKSIDHFKQALGHYTSVGNLICDVVHQFLLSHSGKDSYEKISTCTGVLLGLWFSNNPKHTGEVRIELAQLMSSYGLDINTLITKRQIDIKAMNTLNPSELENIQKSLPPEAVELIQKAMNEGLDTTIAIAVNKKTGVYTAIPIGEPTNAVETSTLDTHSPHQHHYSQKPTLH
ncbi:hypothetical protein [Vibrio owensii]|uniref:hypothetical protein n=1 Tax=Vibrio owensii TaxID=696485 RepID=UPI0018F23279|nr:hypothetical protein [Vibrio owensii]